MTHDVNDGFHHPTNLQFPGFFKAASALVNERLPTSKTAIRIVLKSFHR